MRLILLLPTAYVALVQAHAPQEPKDIIQFIYSHPEQIYGDSQEQSLSPRFFSPHLRNLYAADRKVNEGYAPNLDWDFLSNSQDPEVSQVTTTAISISKDRQTVVVHFLEMKEPQVIEFDFQRVGRIWLIHEVRCPMAEHKWVLSQVLKQKP